ncbi:MAG: hypothetical protein ACTH4Y_08045 [Microbacterium gubbeenense]|uniref:hypothetical protein n=1 Tax=Microbacterium gubbeenense TaxID=159896 RepID=UPI003F9C8360
MDYFAHRGAMSHVARMCGESSAMDVAAERLKSGVQREAASSIETSAFINSINVDERPTPLGNNKGVRDRTVYSSDPGAYWIEYGRSDRVVGENGEEGLSHSGGHYHFAQAIRKLG